MDDSDFLSREAGARNLSWTSELACISHLLPEQQSSILLFYYISLRLHSEIEVVHDKCSNKVRHVRRDII